MRRIPATARSDSAGVAMTWRGLASLAMAVGRISLVAAYPERRAVPDVLRAALWQRRVIQPSGRSGHLLRASVRADKRREPGVRIVRIKRKQGRDRRTPGRCPLGRPLMSRRAVIGLRRAVGLLHCGHEVEAVGRLVSALDPRRLERRRSGPADREAGARGVRGPKLSRSSLMRRWPWSARYVTLLSKVEGGWTTIASS